MTPSRVLVPDPVTFEFENDIKLTTSIDPQTKKHPVTCDLCNFPVDLSISAPEENIHRHGRGVSCRKSVFKLQKELATL